MQKLRDSADDPKLQEEWREVKAIAKKKAAARIESLTGVKVNPSALFDVQVGSALLLLDATPCRVAEPLAWQGGSG